MSFLAAAPASSRATEQAVADEEDLGYVMNVTELWAHDPSARDQLFALLGHVTATGGLTDRQRAVLVTATASAMGDSYCSMAWGGKFAGWADAATSAAVLAGTDEGLDDGERALAAWARQLVRDPNGTTGTDVDRLRAAGLEDTTIFAATVFASLRLAFSTVNDALGATPDAALHAALPTAVADVVTYGRRPDATPASD